MKQERKNYIYIKKSKRNKEEMKKQIDDKESNKRYKEKYSKQTNAPFYISGKGKK